MAAKTYCENIFIRTEPGLRAALADAARREGKSASAFVRAEVRAALTRRGAAVPPRPAAAVPHLNHAVQLRT